MDLSSLSPNRPIHRYFTRASSACKQKFQRLLSFSSANGDTSITPPSESSDDLEAAIGSSGGTCSAAAAEATRGGEIGPVDVEAAAPEEEDQKPFHKRISKAAQMVALFLAATAVTLFINRPAHGGAYILVGYTASIYVAFCMGGGLSLYSIFRRSSPATAWWQTRLMVVGFGSVFVALVLRTSSFL